MPSEIQCLRKYQANIKDIDLTVVVAKAIAPGETSVTSQRSVLVDFPLKVVLLSLMLVAL